MPSSSKEERKMIDGLKLAMSGDEVISRLTDRMDRIRAIIGIKRDAIAGDLEFGELLPDPPPEPESSFSEDIRWVTHPVDVRAALGGSCCPGD
jgi:hypothetical protein